MKIQINSDIFERIEEDALKQAEEAAHKGLFDEAESIGVMTLIKGGVMTQLNLMGMQIWSRLRTARELDDLCAELAAEFEVPCEECRQDVAEFVDDLVQKGFLIRA